jgi:hypothetical protein
LRAGGCEMVRVAVQVRSGAARFSVAVQAESIERALEIAKKQILGRNCEVTVPINSEAFFVAEPPRGPVRPVEISLPILTGPKRTFAM